MSQYKIRPELALSVILFLLSACHHEQSFMILGNIEDPQHQIADTIAKVISRNTKFEMTIKAGLGNLSNLDSIRNGRADFAIVDNFAPTSPEVNAVLPLYPQVLHVVHKGHFKPETLHELLEGRKIFAGIEGSGTMRFVEQLLVDYGINATTIDFVGIYDIFEADVIFSFTDLLRFEELKDLEGYRLFSFDEASRLGHGSLAEGICLRYPQFEPFVIPKELYGRYTENPVLTVKVDALLVCRADLSVDEVYEISKILNEQKQSLVGINPLLADFGHHFDPDQLSFNLHPGAQNYLNRYEPGFLERYADVLSVVLTIIFALISAGYSLKEFQNSKKKNKIDAFYQAIQLIINEIKTVDSIEHVSKLRQRIDELRETTLSLVIDEKLAANESFSIFLNLCTQAQTELASKEADLRPKEQA